MAILAGYSPTKMAQMELKNRLKRAQKGHKLLKDKQEGLMKAFMEIIREAKTLRKEVEENLGNVFFSFLIAYGEVAHPEFIESALSTPSAKVNLTTTTKNVMSVKLADMDFEIEGDIFNYGFSQTNAELDNALSLLQKVFPTLIKLAEIEKKAELMADELEKTRRRVNALEHVMIPNLEDTIKFIKQNLDERARSEIIVSMIVKEQTAS